MKFLLDQGLARSTVSFLAAIGLEAEHVGDLNLAKASDETLLGEGRARDSMVVTLDLDFHSLLAHSNAKSPSVIRIRIEGLKGEDVARIIQQVVEAVKEDLLAGAAVSVNERHLHLRRLPIVKADDLSSF
jgi:predicted nuclease of predicted toxin-antitoxin system